MVLALLGALLIGLSLGLLGSGGSILTVPVLVYLVGQEEKVAIAGSLGIVGVVSLAGAIPNALRGRISWKDVLWFGVPGMAGTWLGALLSRYLSGTTQLILFAIVMLLAAALMLRTPKARSATESAARPRAPAKIALEGVIVGVLTGLVGVGGGFLIVPALVLLGGMPMHLAIGTSLMIIAMKSASGFVKYLTVLGEQGLALDWQVVGGFSAAGVLGTLVGGSIAGRMPQQVLRRLFGAMLVVMASFILWNSLAATPHS